MRFTRTPTGLGLAMLTLMLNIFLWFYVLPGSANNKALTIDIETFAALIQRLRDIDKRLDVLEVRVKTLEHVKQDKLESMTPHIDAAGLEFYITDKGIEYACQK